MPKININAPHNHDWDDLVRRVEDYLLRLRDDKLKAMGFKFKWDGAEKKNVTFEGKGFDGNVAITEKDVTLVVNLSMMLAPFKGKVEESMRRGLEKSLS